jgi:Lanthionine synthetase C-like protein
MRSSTCQGTGKTGVIAILSSICSKGGVVIIVSPSSALADQLRIESLARTDEFRDNYALAMLISHAFLGCDPAGLAPGAGRIVGQLLLLGFPAVAGLVKQLTSPTFNGASLINADLLSYRSDGVKLESLSFKKSATDRKRALRYAYESALSTRNYRIQCERGVTWGTIDQQQLGIYECINNGAAGTILGLLTVSDCCGRDDFLVDIEAGAEWLASRRPGNEAHGLFTGNAGVAVALAVVGAKLRRIDFIEAAFARMRAAFYTRDDYDLFSGMAGVLWGSVALSRVTGDNSYLLLARGICNRLVEDVEKDNGIYVW